VQGTIVIGEEDPRILMERLLELVDVALTKPSM